jgi:hypothetical protein
MATTCYLHEKNEVENAQTKASQPFSGVMAMSAVNSRNCNVDMHVKKTV